MIPLRPLVIVGAGGHAREALEIVRRVNAHSPTWKFIGFVVDEEYLPSTKSAIGSIDALRELDAAVVVAVGDPQARSLIESRLPNRESAVTLVDPSASVSPSAQIGPGSILAPGSSVSTDATLGRHVHVNVNASVAHDCEIGDFVSLSPGVNLGGHAAVGRGVFVGIGATVIDRRRIGDGALVGAGAVVIRDVGEYETVVGVPALPIARQRR